MIESFDAYWPVEVPLHVYVEGFVPERRSPRIIYHDLLKQCPGLVAFKRRHADHPAAHGRDGRKRWTLRIDWSKPKFKLRRVERGRGYRWNAVRFAHKAFAIFAAARSATTDVLFWIDADIRVFADIPAAFLDTLVPEGCMVGYLARPKFSECGFVGYNLRHRSITAFLADFEAQYGEDRLFHLREFHDSYVFDSVLRRFKRRGCRTHDIAAGRGSQAGHVFVNSPLGQYMDHMKGERKSAGASRRSDLIGSRAESYWQGLPT
jgi:hypothetical protein